MYTYTFTAVIIYVVQSRKSVNCIEDFSKPIPKFVFLTVQFGPNVVTCQFTMECVSDVIHKTCNTYPVIVLLSFNWYNYIGAHRWDHKAVWCIQHWWLQLCSMASASLHAIFFVDSEIYRCFIVMCPGLIILEIEVIIACYTLDTEIPFPDILTMSLCMHAHILYGLQFSVGSYKANSACIAVTVIT